MPIVKPQKYKVPFWHFNGHLQTILPSIQRKIEGITYKRERIELEDGDFFDFDWLKNGNQRLVVVLHGLEGGTDRHYCKGIAKLFSEHQWDVLGWNCRSCSGEINRLPRFYHHGDIKDVEVVLAEIEKHNYKEIAFVGFSMGGAISLNTLGTPSLNLSKVIGAVAVSTPIDLKTCSDELEKRSKRFYNQKFYKKLSAKVVAKTKVMDGLDDTQIQEGKINSLRDFDHFYTAPLHGFKSTDDFYYQASPERKIHNIQKPVLLLNALNDPFLTKESYPFNLAKESKYLYLEAPKKGGHVGFCRDKEYYTYSEQRSLEFLNNCSAF
ncbi:YheT family hydrolase [Flammeovirga sp. SJP92]|uniref:YheT family hydrolase n=1 Tax=Flammeovirga sp. SJP92 TaxID=1775430 RepID=UPI00078834F9|nr:alpha/beta fold hydrolase [Flammeovirga sp. SJP92]KXX69729.1 alpha/beta hydrolase [Flammeovirga sp. SJP92]